MILIWTGHSISSSMMEIDWISLSIPVIVDESSWFNSSGHHTLSHENLSVEGGCSWKEFYLWSWNLHPTETSLIDNQKDGF